MPGKKSVWIWIILAGLGLAAAAAPLPSGAAAPAHRTIRIEASSYQFDPGVVKVNRGDEVTIELVSRDVVHGLFIDGYDLSLSADPGQTQRLTFIADRAGAFRMRCSVTCGALHPFMLGKFQVGPNTLLWRAAALAVLALPGLWLLQRQAYHQPPAL